MRHPQSTYIDERPAVARRPRVSAVVVSWNRREDLRRCLRSLRRSADEGLEIIVVDNGSTDGTREFLARERGVRVLDGRENIGPAAARNRGIACARGEYILLIDSDAALSRRALGTMVERMDGDPRLGIVGCRIMSGFSRRLDQWIYTQEARTHERSEFETYSFSAAGALIRASALRAAGPFWGDLFIYNEEVELSIRILRQGYRILYCPDARVLHYPTPAGRLEAKKYWYFQIRNWIWIYYRHYPAFWRVRGIAIYAGAYAWKSLRAGALGPCLGGIWDGLRRRDLIAAYPDKLERDELRRFRGLKRRRLMHALHDLLPGLRAGRPSS